MDKTMDNSVRGAVQARTADDTLPQAADSRALERGAPSGKGIAPRIKARLDRQVRENARPVLSICIPTYNRAPVLRACLNKLLSYPVQGLEFVVCDDASGDDTAELLKTFSDPRLSVFRNAYNVGASYNSHLSFSRAKGKYALLISDEDDLFPEALEELVFFFRQREDIAVYIAGGIRGENDIKSFPAREYPDGFSALWQLGYCTRYMSGVIFQTDLYRRVIGEVSYEDAPRVFNVYSFMYAMAKLFFFGKVITSNQMIFRETRFVPTTLTNNNRDNMDVFYFEPEGRRSQIRCSVRSLAQLPITREQKISMLCKIYYDSADVMLRSFNPAYLPRYQEMIPAHYQQFLSHMKAENIADALVRLEKALDEEAEVCGICSAAERKSQPDQDPELSAFVAAREAKLAQLLQTIEASHAEA